VVKPQSDLRITNAALGDELKDKSGRTTVKLTYPTAVTLDSDDDDGDSLSSTFLCSLTAGKVRSSTAGFIT
jgi:FK506-binding nuclear protein